MPKEIIRAISRIRRASLFVASICLLLMSGCGSPGDPSGAGGSNDGAATITQEDTCSRLLKNALSMLSPERLDLDVENQDAVALLNQWVTDCSRGMAEIAPLDAESAQLVRGLVAEHDLADMDSPHFNSRDIKHVRTCLMMKNAIEAAAKGDTDLARVTDVFEYVMRNVALEGSSKDVLPATSNSVLLFGRGSPEDRAWIFASLLKQLKIDAVVLLPQSEGPATGSSGFDERWLVGVLLDDGVYLFDTRLGCPIPSAKDPGDSPMPRIPATLDEAAANPEILKSLDLPGGRPYLLRSADLAKPRVQIIGELSYWVGRMERLQLSLAGASTVVVYDPLGDVQSKTGLVRRVVEAPHARWTKADVSLWPHPERSTTQFEQLFREGDARDRNEESARRLEMQLAFTARAWAFQAPIPLVRDQSNNLVIDERTGRVKVQRGQREHQRARIMQLSGQIEGAKRSFTVSRMDVNLDPTIPYPDGARCAHLMAADNAMFWGAVCLLEEGDLAAASPAFKRYLRQAEQLPEAVAVGGLTVRPGEWKQSCRVLLVECMAQLGQYEQAIAEVEKVPPTDARRAGLDLLVQRWKKRSGDKAPAPAKDANAAESPAPIDAAFAASTPSPPK